MLLYLFCEKGAAGVAASRGKKTLSVDSDMRELALSSVVVNDFFSRESWTPCNPAATVMGLRAVSILESVRRSRVQKGNPRINPRPRKNPQNIHAADEQKTQQFQGLAKNIHEIHEIHRMSWISWIARIHKETLFFFLYFITTSRIHGIQK